MTLHMPRIVAAATLRLALAEELNLPAPRPISDRYKARLQILQRSSDPSISPQTEEEAEAWVTYLRLVRRRESLSRLKLHEGDIVETKAGEVAEVSSIGQDGRVSFKGGRGFGSWPDLISVVREGMSTLMQPQRPDGRLRMQPPGAMLLEGGPRPRAKTSLNLLPRTSYPKTISQNLKLSLQQLRTSGQFRNS